MGENILSSDRSYNNGLERGLLVGREEEPAAALGVEIRLDGACRRVTVDAVSLSEDHPWRAATEELLREGEALLGPADDEE